MKILDIYNIDCHICKFHNLHSGISLTKPTVDEPEGGRTIDSFTKIDSIYDNEIIESFTIVKSLARLRLSIIF